jgi:hypothetical protein
MENEILILMLIICLLIIYLYQNYVETTLNNFKENLKIIDADEIDMNDKYKYNKIYRKNICVDKDEFINGKDKISNNKIYREVKKSPKSILKNKDIPKRKSNKKVEIIDNDSCSIGDLLNNGNEMMSLNGIDNTLSDVESFIN